MSYLLSNSDDLAFMHSDFNLLTSSVAGTLEVDGEIDRPSIISTLSMAREIGLWLVGVSEGDTLMVNFEEIYI